MKFFNKYNIASLVLLLLFVETVKDSANDTSLLAVSTLILVYQLMETELVLLKLQI